MASTAPPSLISEPEYERTNTLALVLPHLALFEPPSLRLLREHYGSFGEIAHWAPVKGFGRVIIVYHRDDDAATAKREGDRLFLNVDLGEEEGRTGGGEAFKHKRRKSQPPHGLLLRIYPMPPTPLDIDPSTSHLAPPVSDKNFLISPPGSPPEGWAPIVEDAPNSQTLADDLHRALEGLVLNGRRSGRGEGAREVILEGDEGTGGVRVEVEDTSMLEVPDEVHEVPEDLGTWRLPSQAHGQGQGQKPAPTARPPM